MSDIAKLMRTDAGDMLAMQAEIERLKAALQLAQRWAGEAADALQPSAEENERLKAALRAITEETDMDAMIVIAHAALEKS